MPHRSSTANTPSLRGRSTRAGRRRGAAAVETALLLPLLILLAFGSIELSNMIFLKQTLSIAAYEGARAATRPGATAEQANTRVREVLAARKITKYSVNYTTDNAQPLSITATTPRGTLLTVNIESSNGGGFYGPLHMFTGRVLRCRATMVRQ